VSPLRKRSQIFLMIIVIFLFILFGIPVGIILGYWNRLPSLDSLEYENKSWQFPSKVFSDVARIYPETSYEKLIQRLERLNYQTEFYLINSESSDTNEIRLYLRHLKYPRLDREPMFVVIRTDKGNITAIKNKEGLPLNEFILEPEAIDEFYGGEGIDREIITLSQVTEDLRNAFIAIEDKRFYKHIGIDPYRIIAAIVWDIKHKTREQGGSTITQQLARDLFLTRERIVTRKIKEWLMAIRIERKYTKDEILERYLNRVNLGRVGSREIYGVEQAAKYYFGKHASELSIPECATLAGIPKWPPRYSPIKNPENSKARRQLVLKQMFDLKYISKAQYDNAVNTQLVTVSMGESWSADIAYFLEYVRMELEKRFEPSALYGQGFNIYTTMDMSMQLSANSAVQKQLRIFDKSLKFPSYEENKTKWFANDRREGISNPESFIQASLVSMEPSTGYIKAMVGGRDFSINQFNRATQAQRQPGSSFKPFVYCAAFANKLATPADIIIDASWRIKVPDGIWEPKNFSHKYSGAVTLRTALVKSLNVPTAKLMNERVGISKVVDLAKSMGIQSPLAHVPSLALGSSEVNVLEITSAYSVWANQGVRAEPISVKYVIDREDNIVEENAPKTKRVLEKNVAYQMIYVMKGVVDGGTGSRIRSLGFKRPAAGKTGTTNDSTDAWFIGFVPDLTTGVWVGFDDTKSTHRTGSEAALPIWADYMKSVVEGPEKDFPVPGGVMFRSVGTVIGSGSKEAFLPGTSPKSSSSGEDDFGL
jgi:1A family penicillin-binding protein